MFKLCKGLEFYFVFGAIKCLSLFVPPIIQLMFTMFSIIICVGKKRFCTFIVRTYVSYFMGCASVQEDNPRALASGLSPYGRIHHSLYSLLHQHVFACCALQDA